MPNLTESVAISTLQDECRNAKALARLSADMRLPNASMVFAQEYAKSTILIDQKGRGAIFPRKWQR